ncbi:MAG: OmpA family protein [bacterium]
MKFVAIILCIIALVLAAIAYYFYNNNIQTKNELNFKIGSLEQQKAALENELEIKISEVSKEKEEQIERLKNAYDKLVLDMEKEIEEGQIQITQLADRLSVSMVDRILFPSGKAEITPDGLKVLERVGNVLKNTENKIIRVEGHTDNVAIHSKLQEQFPTNWELSAARAINVVRFLEDNVGIQAVRLQAIGMSEYHPVASNKTSAGRSQNRRIELILLPEIAGEIYSPSE